MGCYQLISPSPSRYHRVVCTDLTQVSPPYPPHRPPSVPDAKTLVPPRYYGRLILSWCLDSPNFDSLCNRHLSAASARNIRNMSDKIVAKGIGTLPAASDRTSGRLVISS